MAENKNEIPKKTMTLDWLLSGSLSRIGDMFDRLTGRNWTPSSSLATSELIERMRKLLDAEAREMEFKGRFVPHNLKLKIQWDKFSTDAEQSLESLKNELLTAAIDHINDRVYHTFAPLNIEIKTDYFVEGVQLTANFGGFLENDSDVTLNVTLPNANVNDLAPSQIFKKSKEAKVFTATLNNEPSGRKINLTFDNGKRVSVGRTRENQLSINDPSVSKIHASLFVDGENRLFVADTGSTNGTFINGERIGYGKSHEIKPADAVKFGDAEVFFEPSPENARLTDEVSTISPDSVVIDGFEFKSGTKYNIEQSSGDADTSIDEKSSESHFSQGNNDAPNKTISINADDYVVKKQ